MKKTRLGIAFFCALCIWSCTNDSEADLIEQEQMDDEPTDGSGVTYENTIRSIMQSSCVNCHDDPPRNGAPFALVTFQQVSSRANGILEAMSRQSGESAAMPPAGRLPQNTIDQIQQWIDNGLPEN
ncbi:hypothetical protein FK220_003130 [Flavobacteriaceae bacterium TP-CH-4]|uniref:Cytochrome c domain-containing protein n=1 Tax=Pelagihabitans pacificus TaxID=2696054 RepID=A0A967AQ66_9FLAO|nr:hypothetical protein [Pelagihabitans pacificus]NHF58319.1 hypothetical protein [Pelagihabitans pacificus]